MYIMNFRIRVFMCCGFYVMTKQSLFLSPLTQRCYVYARVSGGHGFKHFPCPFSVFTAFAVLAAPLVLIGS